MSLNNLNIKYVKGVGTKKAELFEKLGIYTIEDAIRYYPRTYEDWSLHTDIADTVLNELNVIRATVEYAPTQTRTSGGAAIYKTVVSDESGSIELTFFNNKYITKMLKAGQVYYFRGKVSFWSTRTMTSPEFYTENKARSIIPVYSATAGLSSTQISTVINQCLNNYCQELSQDCIPDEIRHKYNLCHVDYALKNIHFPMDLQACEIAKKRLIFEELLVLQISMAQIRKRNKTETSHTLKQIYSEDFEKLLPFELTNAQKNAIEACLHDLQIPTPMNRLLQGDVGSGKTAVAAGVCHSAIKNGIQCALMAPTEILATQHYHSLSSLLAPANIKVQLLTGSVTQKNKKIIYQALENGEIDLIIGTHALISEAVQFKNLGLVITDEQHRFGVKQRNSLAEKGTSPHMLVMSATPIPRTLALMIYGDLDISILNELPKGRQKIETYAITSPIRLRAFNYIKKHVAQGRQGYIICPLIEEGESDLASIEAYYDSMKTHFISERIGVLHGKMKAKEKDEVMEKFTKNEIDILLSTTVVEVGVDVPNAVIMLIENAERYGLSQLHQLRGRIGRGIHKSTCILLSDAQNEIATERMQLMCQSSDGFKIAEADLKMRGPGDFFGKRQHGLPKFKIADMANDMQTLQEAQNCAKEILEKDPSLKDHQLLAEQVKNLYKNSGNTNNMTL